MELQEIGTTTDWTTAFSRARELLDLHQLDALVSVTEREYGRTPFVATYLEEFIPLMGSKENVLKSQEELYPFLYGSPTSFRLLHGEIPVSHPYAASPTSWLLVIIYR